VTPGMAAGRACPVFGQASESRCHLSEGWTGLEAVFGCAQAVPGRSGQRPDPAAARQPGLDQGLQVQPGAPGMQPGVVLRGPDVGGHMPPEPVPALRLALAGMPRLTVHRADHPVGATLRREEALAAIEEAATAYRELARARPDAFLPDLAASLNNQSLRLAALGRREEALAAIEEAATAYRELAQARPEVFASRYASSLEAQAAILSELGRDSEAKAVQQQAAAIRRK
jgi:hypothetical protein